MNAHLHQLVEAALAGEDDPDDALEQLDEAVERSPADAGLRRLRARLYQALGMQVERLLDLKALRDLAVGDREIELDYALGLHRWAFLLLDDEDCRDELAEDDDDEQVDPRLAALEGEALESLRRLGEAHASDRDFMLRFFDGWEEHAVWQPWLRLYFVLRALSHRPTDPALRSHLAGAWLALVGEQPAGELADGQVPMGFTVDAHQGMHDAQIAERALEALGDCLAEAGEDGPLLEQRAGLEIEISRFSDAAVDFRAAEAAFRAAARETRDVPQREELEARAEDAAEMARSCDGGRAALADRQLEQMNEALAGLGEAFEERVGLPDELAGMLAQMKAESEHRRVELSGQLDELAVAMQHCAHAPDAAEIAQMAALAETVAARVLGAVEFAPAEWRIHRSDQLADRLDPRVVAAEAGLRGIGLERFGILEHLGFGRQFGQPVLFCLWQHRSGDSVLAHVAVGAIELLEIATELDDGRQLVTTNGRGRNFLGGGPIIDTLHVDQDLGPADLLALHRARLSFALACSLDLKVRPVGDHFDFVAMQERQRRAKLAFRLSEGLSYFEAAGIPGGPTEHFVPLVQAAAKRCIAEAHRDFLAAAGRE